MQMKEMHGKDFVFILSVTENNSLCFSFSFHTGVVLDGGVRLTVVEVGRNGCVHSINECTAVAQVQRLILVFLGSILFILCI